MPEDLELAWFVHDVHTNTRMVSPFDPIRFLHAASARILFNASCTHSEPNRFSCDPLTPTHFTPIICSQISAIRTPGPAVAITYRYPLLIYQDLRVVQVHKVCDKCGCRI